MKNNKEELNMAGFQQTIVIGQVKESKANYFHNIKRTRERHASLKGRRNYIPHTKNLVLRLVKSKSRDER